MRMAGIGQSCALLAAALLLPLSAPGADFGSSKTATAYLRVESQSPYLVFKMAPPRSEKEFEVYKATQQMFVKMPVVLNAALRKPDVVKLPSVQEAGKKGDPVRWLGGLVQVDFPGRGDVMSISVKLGAPKEAAALVNAVVDAYLTQVVSAERDQKRQRLSDLDTVVAEREAAFRAKWETLNSLSEQLLGKNTKEKSGEPIPLDIQLLRADLRAIEEVLHEARLERERLKVEIRRAGRSPTIDSCRRFGIQGMSALGDWHGNRA